jgi:hypothetical protein
VNYGPRKKDIIEIKFRSELRFKALYLFELMKYRAPKALRL